MVAGSINEECAVAVSAQRLWKAAFAGDWDALPKVCAGLIDAVEVQGDGGPGTVSTMKFNPSVGVDNVFKTRLISRDAAAGKVKSEVLQGDKVCAKLKSQVSEMQVQAAGDGACVVKLAVEYDTLDGAPLAAEDQATLTKGYLGLIKAAEAYLVAHPAEFA
ncbi:hypothetical protein ACP70R_032279 [Stipagrostis hirtigluma subsp. patula]